MKKLSNKISGYHITLLALLLLEACIPLNLPVSNSPAPDLPINIPPEPTTLPISTPTPTEIPPTAIVSSEELSSVHLEQPLLTLTAQSAVLLNAQTGDVLYDQQSHQRMFPASTTKIMTALLALEYFRPDERLMVGEEANLAWTASRLDAQKAGLLYGQELTVKELLYGLMLISGSDAAFVLAVNAARRDCDDIFMPVDQAIEHFTDLMNQRASALGAVETNFVNPDGYHNPNHYSTAYDLALIAQQAMQDPIFREIVSTTSYSTAPIATDNGSYSKTWENTNRLINVEDEHYYPAATGIKTGTTTEAGYCLVSSGQFGNETVIAVVLNSTQEGVWSDSVTLLESARDQTH